MFGASYKWRDEVILGDVEMPFINYSFVWIQALT